MTYADYTYYAGTYMGAVSAEDFPRLAVRASSFLDYYTQNRAKDNAELDAVKMCCCALVDQYALLDAAQKAATKSLANAGDPETKSESVGSYSRTLTTGGEAAKSVLDAASTSKQMLANLCNEYLAHTGLLYRGGDCKCTLPTL
nr:MAG: Protein of unknown function (DUF3199) [Bacteriophage sp.]